MDSFILIYIVIAVVTYYCVTKKQPNHPILGAAAWPVILALEYRDRGLRKQHAHIQKGHTKRDKVLLPETVEQFGGRIETRKYGPIDPSDS